MMLLLLKMLLAHVVGDFLLQPYSWVKDKEQRKLKSLKLYLHVLLHGVLVYLFLWDYSMWRWIAIYVLLHAFTDILKLYLQSEKTKPQWFIIDQILHLLSIGIISYFSSQVSLDITHILESPIIWIYVLALLLLTVVAGIVIQVLLINWSSQISDDEPNSLAKAGKYIGMLERLFVFLFILYDQWEGIGFLITAKSVFRFGSLKQPRDRKLTEYLLIGTLLSFAIATAIGLGVLELVRIYN